MTWISKILTSWPAGVLLTAAIAFAFNLLPEHWIAGLPGTFNLKATVRTSKSKSKSSYIADLKTSAVDQSAITKIRKKDHKILKYLKYYYITTRSAYIYSLFIFIGFLGIT